MIAVSLEMSDEPHFLHRESKQELKHMTHVQDNQGLVQRAPEK